MSRSEGAPLARRFSTMVTARGRFWQSGLVEWMLVAAGLACIAAAPPRIWGDAEVRLQSLSRLFGAGHLDAGRYSLAGPVFAWPLWAVHKTEWFNLCVFAIGAFVLQRLLAPLLSARSRARFVLFLLCASELPLDLRQFYGEPFTLFCIAIGTAGLWLGPLSWARLIGFGGLIALGTINTPAALVAVGLACLAIAWRRRDVRILGIPLIALAGILLEAQLRRGSFFANGYEGDHGFRNDLPFSGLPGFSYPFLLGLASLTLSFGRGLFFFAPGVLLPLRAGERLLRSLRGVWLLFVVGLVLVYARWWSWYGGVWFGPRFLLFAAVPAALALEQRSVRRDAGDSPDDAPGLLADLATWAAASLALWVGFCALLYGDDSLHLRICQMNNYRLEPLCWYAPEFSALALPLTAPRAFVLRDWLECAWFVIVYLVLLAPLILRFARAANAGVKRLARESRAAAPEHPHRPAGSL